MTEDTLEDLKQFMGTLVRQEASEVREDISGLRGDITEIRGDIADIRSDIVDVRGDIKRLDKKLTARIDNLSQSVADAIFTSNDAAGEQLQDHERRITVLEQR